LIHKKIEQMYLTIGKKYGTIVAFLKEGVFMEKIMIEGLVSNIATLNIERNNKMNEYNQILRNCNASHDKRSRLKSESAGMKKYIDLSVEDRLEKITSAWALFTAIFSYDFLTFWGGEILDSFLITMFCSVPISTIVFYLCEIVFYDKFVQLLSIFSPDLRNIYNEYDNLNEHIKEANKEIEALEHSKMVSYNELISLEQKIDKNNNQLMNLASVEMEPTVIHEGFTFGKKLTKRHKY